MWREGKANREKATKLNQVIYLIIEAAADISTIYGGDKSEVLPVLPLKIFVVQVARCTVPVEVERHDLNEWRTFVTM